MRASGEHGPSYVGLAVHSLGHREDIDLMAGQPGSEGLNVVADGGHIKGQGNSHVHSTKTTDRTRSRNAAIGRDERRPAGHGTASGPAGLESTGTIR